MKHAQYIVTISCADKPGIVAAVSGALFALGANIAESNQFWDRSTNRFFMRVAIDCSPELDKAMLDQNLKPIADRFAMRMCVMDACVKPKMIIMVSKFDHTLRHLLYQVGIGWLNAEVVAIVSNHETCRAIAERSNIPYYYWPVSAKNKVEQEQKLIDLVKQTGTDLVVLARYMQILSDQLCHCLFGQVINIHHSFLPSFKGAKPYHQAHARGVKLIGATAHYVTADLDEGPIIEQETQRVSHALSAEDFVAVGRDIEARVLAKAVKMHLEARIMINGAKTVVFSQIT